MDFREFPRFLGNAAETKRKETSEVRADLDGKLKAMKAENLDPLPEALQTAEAAPLPMPNLKKEKPNLNLKEGDHNTVQQGSEGAAALASHAQKQMHSR